MSQNLCLCGNEKPYQDCCQPYLLGSAIAATPEALMRSRYSAFCQGEIDYLIATHHPSKREPDDQKALADTINKTKWLKLKVLQASPITPITADKGEKQAVGFVEFVAFYQTDTVEQLHEKSSFIQQDDRWYYIEGSVLAPIKISRNEPCWCGSQKKYKKCHGI